MPTFYLSPEMGRVLLGALRTELGNTFNEVIRASGQFQFGTSSLQTVDANKRYPFEAVSALQVGVEHVHGLNAPVLLRRVGRSAFAIGLSEMEPVVNIADLPLRQIPLNLKFSVGLEVFARILNKYTDQTVKVAELSDRYQWVVQPCPICWERRAESPSCHLVCGLLEEAFAWASGGGRYVVAETKCVARGDATCTFEILKQPSPPASQGKGALGEAGAHHVRRTKEGRQTHRGQRQPGGDKAHRRDRWPAGGVHGDHRDDGAQRGGRGQGRESGRVRGRQTEGVRLLHRLHARRCARQGQTPGDVLVQRRAGVVFGVATPRRARTAPRADNGDRRPAPAAVYTGR